MARELHSQSPFIITQPESWYSFYHPAEAIRLSRSRWLVTYRVPRRFKWFGVNVGQIIFRTATVNRVSRRGIMWRHRKSRSSAERFGWRRKLLRRSDVARKRRFCWEGIRGLLISCPVELVCPWAVCVVWSAAASKNSHDQAMSATVQTWTI